MLRMIASRSSEAAKSYFAQGLSREDYYSQGQEIIGNWGGKAATILGLDGPVTQGEFNALTENVHPMTGERLTPHTRSNRRVGYDINFHAPKSVSVVYSLTKDERILSAFREAVDATMREMEAEMRTQRMVDGQKQKPVTGNMVWAEFLHFTARPVDGIPDPHLHAHCYTFNTTYDHEHGRFRAGEFVELKREAPYYEAAFHARFAKRLAEDGYGVKKTSKGWELAGVPTTAIEKFSRRTQEIEQLARKRGLTNDRDKDGLGALSRERKTKI